MTESIVAVDLFAGAGGTSTGLVEACEHEGFSVDLTAINHWDVAVATHTLNHPTARHLCADLDSTNPRKVMGGKKCRVLWASPSCVHHSRARGGKPVNEQDRATAWCITRWADACRPPIILVENVPEFVTWGPLIPVQKWNEKKKIMETIDVPDPAHKGEIFDAWVNTLRAIGYIVDWRVLCAADYGDPTSRKRLFIQAVLPPNKIVWPAPTHAKDGVGGLQPWLPARSFLEFEKKGTSVYERKKPLVPKTMARILRGYEKFCLEPFLLGQQSAAAPRSADDPSPTVASAGAISLVQPFLVKFRGTNNAADVELPCPTVTATGTHLGLTQPFLVKFHSNDVGASIDEPAPSIHAGGGQPGLIQPYLVQTNHGKSKNVDSAGRVRSVDATFPTVAGNRGEWAVCSPFIVAIDQKGKDGSGGAWSADAPLSTVTTKQRHALCKPYLVKYFGTGVAASVDEPIDTVTSKARFGLVQPLIEIDGEWFKVGFMFRMLNLKELAAAQGFRKDYQFTGTLTQAVKQVGNAVPRRLARAVARAAIFQTS